MELFTLPYRRETSTCYDDDVLRALENFSKFLNILTGYLWRFHSSKSKELEVEASLKVEVHVCSLA